MTVPLLILAVLSVLGGLLNLPESLGGSSLGDVLTRWLENTLANVVPGVFNLGIALGSLGLALVGLIVAWWVYGKRQPLGNDLVDPLRRRARPGVRGLEQKWWVDELYGVLIIQPLPGPGPLPGAAGGPGGDRPGFGRPGRGCPMGGRRPAPPSERVCALLCLRGLIGCGHHHGLSDHCVDDSSETGRYQ